MSEPTPADPRDVLFSDSKSESHAIPGEETAHLPTAAASGSSAETVNHETKTPVLSQSLLQRAGQMNRADLLRCLQDDQRTRWKRRERFLAESYREQVPALRDDTEGFLDLVYHEIVLREDAGEAPNLEEYRRRFPEHGDSLSRLFDLHFKLGETSVRDGATVSFDSRTGPSSQPPVGPRGGLPGQVGGYEILDELGRGGMGVVYKARQVALKRMVALKMILSGGHAGAAQRERFHAEAEVVARLKHPHIVEIYDIGEADGQPFFALEYIEGGSLAQKLGGVPMPSLTAAVLVETLARAMHHAHQGGVLHRDLKPANVLLTADGQPKITDFGLAKQLDTEGRTASGEIMGTPSYMPPEQAAGKIKELGPSCDIYALGAILYECLTGQPPFRGATPMETVLQVLKEEPAPVRQRNPQAPRDLETICHKCLQKEPAYRYSSALQLAQDIERFRGGDSILARPDGLARKSIRLLRKRWQLVGTGLIIAAVLIVALTAFLGGRNVRRAAELDRQLQAGLEVESTAWSPALIEEQEQRIAELQLLAPDQAAVWREKLQQRFHSAILARIEQPRLDADDNAAIEQLIGVHAQRWPDSEQELRVRLQKRLREWQTIAELSPPFDGWESLVMPGVAKLQNSRLISQVTGEQWTVLGGGPAGPLRCEGYAEIEARWDESWLTARTIGLTLNSDQDRGYCFFLAVDSFYSRWGGREESTRRMSMGGPTPSETTFGDIVRSGGELYLQIWRNWECLREQAVIVPATALQFRARREGDQLECQVGSLEPLRFVDAVPLLGRGSYWLQWPSGVGLTSLRCRSLAQAGEPSLLERADGLLAQGRFEDALAAYQQSGLASGKTATEARYKKALCLLGLNRADEAGEELENAAASEGDRWPLLAAYRLWLLRLDRNQLDKAENIFEALAARARPQDILMFVPEEQRGNLVGRTALGSRSGLHYLRASAETCDYLAKTFRACELLQMPAFTLGAVQDVLVRNRWCAGQAEQALADAERWLVRCEKLEPVARLRSDRNVIVFTDWAWLKQGRGPADSREALERMNAWLTPVLALEDRFLVYGLNGSLCSCMLQRARLRGAVGEWAGAEQDIAVCERLLSIKDANPSYLVWSNLYLLKGFLCERRGDDAGKRAAWQRGTWKGFRAAMPRVTEKTAPVNAVYVSWFLHAATNQLEEGEAKAIMEAALAGEGDKAASQLLKIAGFSAAIVKEAMLSPRGVEFNRGCALGTISLPEFLRGPPRLLLREMWRIGAFGGNYSAPQEELIWKLSTDGMELYAKGAISPLQATQLGLCWKGITGPFGWGDVSPKLPPNVRGPTAYVFGKRMQQIQNPQAARIFFQSALVDAEPESNLLRLTKAELDRLDKK